MKILITGAGGMIGRELGLELARQGHTLHVLTRDAQRARRECPFPCDIFLWGDNYTIPSAAVRDVDGVFHLAGENIAAERWTEERKKKIINSRVQSTNQLLEALSKSALRCKWIVMASAIGYYGDRQSDVLDEASPRGRDFLSDVCEKWESALFKTPLSAQIRRVALRTGVVFGLSGGILERVLPLFLSGAGGAIGSGQQWMSWIHIQDLVRVYLDAMNENRDGVFNAVAPQPITNATFTRSLARALDRPALLSVPSVAIQLAFGEMATILLESQRVAPERLMQSGFDFKFETLDRALGNLIPVESRGCDILETHQWLPKPREEVFRFFCDESNLEKLTPPFLNFSVRQKSTDHIETGTLIDYGLKLHGIPISWTSKIERWVPNEEFIDIQIRGPYARWWHRHQFESLGGGTLISDRVEFKVPFSFVGRGLVGWKVWRDVQNIFVYRRGVIDSLFGVSKV